MKNSDDRELQANLTPFGLRMQSDLKSRVATAAARNNRSMNAEIVATLEHAYPATDAKTALADFIHMWIVEFSAAKTPQTRAAVARRANDWSRVIGANVSVELKEAKSEVNVEALVRAGSLEMILTLWGRPGSDSPDQLKKEHREQPRKAKGR